MKAGDSQTSREHALLLLSKAWQDECVLDLLLKDESKLTEIFGFHAQQATEKLLKAAAVCKGLAYPRTHRLLELIDVLLNAGTADVSTFEDLRILTPFAVEFRYDAMPAESKPTLDFRAIRGRIVELRRWVESLLP